jgi:hypothetical protein
MEYTHAELYFFDDGRLALMTYYAQPNAKLPVVPWDEELQTAAVGGEIEAGLLTEGLKNTFSDERLGWVAEKEGGIPLELYIPGYFLCLIYKRINSLEFHGNWSTIVIQFYKDSVLVERMHTMFML